MNGTLFNRRLFAGVAGAALAIAANASFVADASVITANATQTHRPEAAWAASIAPTIWDGEYVQTLGGSWTINAELVGQAHKIAAGRGNLLAESSWFGYSYTEVSAEADFQPTLTVEFLPYDEFGSLEFAGSGTVEFEAAKVQLLNADWALETDWNVLATSAERVVEGEWTATTGQWLFEPTLQPSGGISVIEQGYSFWTNESGFETAQDKTITFVGDAVWRQEITFGGTAQLTQKLEGTFSGAAYTYLPSNVTKFVEGEWLVGSSSLEGEGSYIYTIPEDDTEWASGTSWGFLQARQIHNIQSFELDAGGVLDVELLAIRLARVDFAPFIDLQMQATHTHRLFEQLFADGNVFFADPAKVEIFKTRFVSGNFPGTAEFVSNDVRTKIATLHLAESSWAITSVFKGVGSIPKSGSADWTGLGGSLSAPAVLKTSIDGEYVPAPTRRQLWIPEDDRRFFLTNDGRVFYIYERSADYEV